MSYADCVRTKKAVDYLRAQQIRLAHDEPVTQSGRLARTQTLLELQDRIQQLEGEATR